MCACGRLRRERCVDNRLQQPRSRLRFLQPSSCDGCQRTGGFGLVDREQQGRNEDQTESSGRMAWQTKQTSRRKQISNNAQNQVH